MQKGLLGVHTYRHREVAIDHKSKEARREQDQGWLRRNDIVLNRNLPSSGTSLPAKEGVVTGGGANKIGSASKQKHIRGVAIDHPTNFSAGTVIMGGCKCGDIVLNRILPSSGTYSPWLC